MRIFFRFNCCSLLYLLFYKSRIYKKSRRGFLIKETNGTKETLYLAGMSQLRNTGETLHFIFDNVDKPKKLIANSEDQREISAMFYKINFLIKYLL